MQGRRGFFSHTLEGLGLNILATASPLNAMQHGSEPELKGQSFRELDKEKLAMEFPGEGIKKIAIPFNERKGKIKFPNNKQLAVHVYVAIEYHVHKPVTAPGAVVK